MSILDVENSFSWYFDHIQMYEGNLGEDCAEFKSRSREFEKFCYN